MLNKLVALGLLFILVGFIGILAVDLVKLHQNLEAYKQVHGFDESEITWWHRSQLNYVLTSSAAMAFCVAGIVIAILNLQVHSTARSRALYSYVALLGTLVLVGFYRWWQAGFDHW